MTKIEGVVTDLGCMTCVSTITKALLENPSVHTVHIDQPTKKTEIEYNESEISPEVIVGIVKNAGYTLALS